MSYSDVITLRPGARHFVCTETRPFEDGPPWPNKDVEVHDFWRHHHNHLVIEEGATLEDFLTCLGNAFTGWDGVRQLNHYCQCNFQSLLVDMRGTPRPEIDANEIDFLEVFPILEINRYGKKTDLSDFSSYWCFHGWGTWSDKGVPAGTKGGYAIEMSPISELKHLPLKIKNVAELGYSGGRPKYVYTKVMDVRVEPTFLEVVKAVLWELSFFGSPQERDDKTAELKQAIADIESGAVKTVSWKSVKNRLMAKVKDKKKARS